MNKLCSISLCESPSRKRTWCVKHYHRWKTHGDPEYTPPSPEERFWAKVDKNGENGCWIWTAYKNQDGYGRFLYNKRLESAHRVSWVLAGLDLPKGILLDHKCYEPACVNVKHLRLATHKQNMENIKSLRNNSSGHRGVSLRAGLWRARVTHNHKTYDLGSYKVLQDAIDVVTTKRNELFTHNISDRV